VAHAAEECFSARAAAVVEAWNFVFEYLKRDSGEIVTPVDNNVSATASWN
jgi:hypothetical protein